MTPCYDLWSFCDFGPQKRQLSLWRTVPIADRRITELDEVAKSQIGSNVNERVDGGEQREVVPIDPDEILLSAQCDPALIDAEVSVG
ncbi:MAG: hypothetical protein L0K67_04350 [Brevibacterium sp.]|nr:hypothetical protein [Brevibacterium sp.]